MLHLQILTPDRTAFIGDVNEVVVPGVSGLMGILPRHVNLFAQLTDGEVKIKKSDEDIYMGIGGGFIEVVNNAVNILVTRAVFAHELEEEKIRQARQQAAQTLRQKVTDEERRTAQLVFRRSLVDLRLLRRRKVRA